MTDALTSESLDLLFRAMDSAGCRLTAVVMDQFKTYYEMLQLWSRRMNLVSKGDRKRLVSRHFLESAGFSIVHSFDRESLVLDIGTGAGFPGLPVKLIRPDLRLCLVDSRDKKIRFVGSVIKRLRLKETEAVCERIENLNPSLHGPVDYVVSRAVAELRTLSQWSLPLLRSGGRLIALKGSGVEKELDMLHNMDTEFAIAGIEVKPYDPFPDVLPLSFQKLVIVTYN